MSLLILLALFFTGAPQADVTVVSTSTAVNSTSSPTSITLTLPTGSQPGDLLVSHLAIRAGTTVTAPAGWTTVLGPSTRDNIRHQIWYRTVPALSLGSQTWTFSSGSRAVAGMISLRGVDGANPIAASGSNTGNSATATAPSLTSSSAGSYLLAFFAGDNGNTAMANGTVANSPGWSFATGGGTGSGVTGALFHRALPTVGGSGTSQASASNDWIASTVIINAGAGLSCYSDQFTRTSLGTDWAVGSSSGSFGSPQIVSNRLRMTNASSNVATAATLQRLFPTTGNFIQIEFTLHDYGGSGADGIAIILSDATIAPVPGGYGGSLGYAQRSGVNGFAGGWLGVGLDEYGNYSSASEGRVGGTGFVADAVAIRGSGSSTSGYRFVAGSSSLTPGVDGTPAAGHRYRITINATVTGTVAVSVERDTAGTGAYSTLVSVANILTATGQAALPANLIFSITGSTGGSTNIHEVDDLGVCASQINAMAQIDHVRFVTDADALTCQPESITMYACNDSSCSSLYAGATSISLTPPSNWVGGNVASFSGGSTSKSLQRTTTGTVAIGVSGSTPSATNPARCFTGGPPGGTEIPCSVLFRDSGFAFDVPNLTANKLATAIKVRAVRKDLVTQQCTPAFSGNRQVFWYGRYQNPTTGSLPVFLSDPNESQNISTVNNAAAAPTGTAFTHVFDSNGETEINVRYADAGQLQLTASYTGSAGTGDAGLSLTGNDSFVSVPAGFCIEAMQLTAPTLPYFDLADAVARNGCTSAACSAYQRAGVNFPLRVRAMAWQSDSEADADFCPELPAAVSPTNALTPNFAGAVSLGAELPVETPTDAALLDNASLSQTSVTLAAGSTTISNQQLSEVGRFRIRSGGSYLGAALPTSASLRIGRITPNRYDISVTAYQSACVDALTPANSFSYAGLSGGAGKAGQPFSLTASIDAMNGATPAVRSRNYSAGYATLDGSSLTLNDFSSGVAATDGAFSASHSLSFTEGNAIAAPASASYLFNSTRAPYPVALEASATDSDGVTGSSARTGEIGFRLGRMVLENAYGPEQLPLPIPLRAEYFDGSRWRRNSLDNCSSYASSAASRDQFTGTLSDALTSFDSPTGSQLLQTGIAQTSQPLRIRAPGLGNWGSLRVQLTVPSWLQFDWDGDGSQDDPPTAVATFGRYRGSDRVIYWRERLPVIP